ncbi:hypothetical protein HOLleu_33676 [Holothuria leucospilota]|uniref:Domain of unknown function with conserved HDNR motif domain-containing protein n=1 Tax=Holothuria leucospilota TaxID=206669 RepID=A0A9Q0YP25_HOLLE|nr:hypothetical protein HOLleu_33676 [Holothuria leucospilota]
MSLKVREPRVPGSSGTDGNWFQTRGWKDPPLERDLATTTGAMLSKSGKSDDRPKSPPPKFNEMAQASYGEINTFSMHDNRNSFQDHGVYFGHGLGKRLTHGPGRQHNSNDSIAWNSTERHYSTSTGSTYTGKRCKEPPTHRFPQEHKEPQEGLIKPSTTTTEWFKPPDVPYKTDTQVLVSSQEPHLKPNPWKYSQKPAY